MLKLEISFVRVLGLIHSQDISELWKTFSYTGTIEAFSHVELWHGHSHKSTVRSLNNQGYTGIDGSLPNEYYWIIKLAQYRNAQHERHNGSLCLDAVIA